MYIMYHNNTLDATRGPGTVYPSGAPAFTAGFCKWSSFYIEQHILCVISGLLQDRIFQPELNSIFVFWISLFCLKIIDNYS
jgi:hypothetical protein